MYPYPKAMLIPLCEKFPPTAACGRCRCTSTAQASSCAPCQATDVTSVHVPVVESDSRSSNVSNSVAVAAALAPSCSGVADKPCRQRVMQHEEV
jgi:hypothetical protein